MGADLDNAILAVDGGGTSCRFACESEGVRRVVTLGSANVTTDFEGSVAVILEGLGRLATEVGVTVEALAALPAYLGLAGVVDAETAAQVRAALPLKRATVADDRRSSVRGALGTADGVLAGLGTGSFFARQKDDAIRLAGGWGARLGDEASGYWIARKALAATLAAVDGLVADTGLTRALMARFGGRPTGIVVFAFTAPTVEVAALAPQVIGAAESGDPVGRDVLARGARHVVGTLQAMGWDVDPLCLIGGVSDAYRSYLPEGTEIVVAKGTALDGALELARSLGGRA